MSEILPLAESTQKPSVGGRLAATGSVIAAVLASSCKPSPRMCRNYRVVQANDKVVR